MMRSGITKQKLNDLEKVSATVNLLQKHVRFFMNSNIALQKKNVLNLRFTLRIMSSIATEHVSESLAYLAKKREQVNRH